MFRNHSNGRSSSATQTVTVVPNTKPKTKSSNVICSKPPLSFKALVEDSDSDSDTEIALETRRRGLGLFNHLPARIVDRIIALLDAKDWCRLAQTSRCFALIFNNEELWKKNCKRVWKGNLWFRGTWKRTVLDRFKPESVVTPKKPPPKVAGMSEWYHKQWKDWRISQYDLSVFYFEDPHAIDRRSGLSVADFIEQYERHHKPVILTDAIEQWPARRFWTADGFLQRYGHLVLRAGSGFKISVRNYYQYMRTQSDSAPLYMFDGKLPERAPELLECFAPPLHFADCYFARLPSDERPPFRWLMLGPARTGPAFHIDPYCTPAWNAILFGSKKWAMYPKNVSPAGAGDPDSDYYEAPRPIRWYEKYYDDLPAAQRPLEFLHREGETLFLPPGWWHQVINLENTLAVTQNFVSLRSLPVVWEDTKKDKSFHAVLNETLMKYPAARQVVGL